ncbi:hypothetical protein GCM10022223_20360 [Kineosporia mesophila]|uniref:DUF4179 domain-containing protein n=1 Tax=Kineosporia mesophila TaxID=566012 RepID=A0ABP6ZCB6_9ACTN|nr:hypothetical protein [Kineosporia mesophila]MCD5350131.1 hypothetical protein [Kineosporia mesophila]
MNAEPTPLSERLKQLDAVTQAQGMPAFDLDAAVRGGERRQQRRSIAGTAAATVGAGLVAAALFAGGAHWNAFWDVDSDPAPSAVPVDLVYAQRGDSVTVSRGRDPLARVTVTSAAIDAEGHGTVAMRVESDAGFVIQLSDFIWAGESLDRLTAATSMTVDGSQTINWTYDGVSEGELAWVRPGTDRLAGVWSVGAGDSGAVGAVAADRSWYLQVGSAVTVYEGVEPQARMTVSSVAVGRTVGAAHVSVTAHDRYELRADDFVWAEESGPQHAPLADDWRSLSVRDDAVNTGDLRFAGVGEGYLLWAPDGRETAGVWLSPAVAG